MRYCTNCGAKLSDEHKFCPYCGYKVDDSYAAPTPENVASETPFDETSAYSAPEEPSRDDIDNYFNNVNGEEKKADGESHYNHNAKDTSPVFAILALVFGILGGWLAIVFGAIGLTKYKSGPYRNMCIAGIVLGVVWICIIVAIRVTGVLNL